MEIGLTSVIQKKADITNVAKPVEEELFFCWDAHVIKYGSRQALLVINAKTRLASLMINLKPRDWKNLGKTVSEAIIHAMKSCGYSNEQIRSYFNAAKEIRCTKTHGKTILGVINIYGRYIEVYIDLMDKDNRYQEKCSRRLHGDIFEIIDPTTNKKQYYHPDEYFDYQMKRYKLL